MGASVGLLLRGMRWRMGASVLTVIASAIAVVAAVLGPLYMRAAGDSAVRTAVTSASVEDRGVTLSAPAGQKLVPAQVQRAERVVVRAGSPGRWYGQPLTTVISGVQLTGRGSSPLSSQLLARTGICGMLRFEAGRCDLGPGDVAISARSAREMGVSLGSVFKAGVGGTAAPVHLKVTGIYAVPNVDLPYWWGDGRGYFAFGQETGGPNKVPEIDSLITSPATALAVPAQDLPEVMGQVGLRASRVTLSDEAALQQALARATVDVRRSGVLLSTQLSSLLGHAAHERHVMAAIVVVAAVELVLLALWVLGSLLVRTSDARRSEIRVARLRGFPALTMLWTTVAEPAILCLLGIVIGLGAAWGAVVLGRDQLLNPAASVSPDLWVFAALGLTLVAIVGALGISSARLMRTSGVSETRARTVPVTGRASLVADVVLVVLSVVALVGLGTSGALSGRSDPIAAAAPGLIALGVAVIAVQLVLFACRMGVAATAHSARVAPFLGLRQAVRRPGILRQGRVLIIALALACFATSAWVVARNNRSAAATFSVGTTTVVNVTPRGATLQEAVDRADPQGHFAMAAVSVATPSSTLLAVDAHRLSTVAFWPRGISRLSPAAIARLLHPPTLSEVTLPGGPVRVSANATASARALSRLGNLDLSLWVFNPQVGTSIVSLGALRRGPSIYDGSLAYDCPGGCRLVGLGVVPAANRQGPASGTIELAVSAVSARSSSRGWEPVGAHLLPDGWRPTNGGLRVESRPARALTFVIPASAAAADAGAAGSSTPPLFSIADVPQTLPAAATSEIESINGAAPSFRTVPTQGLDGATLNVAPAATASALPRVGGDAVMVDLDLLSRLQSGPTFSDATDQVWLGPAAPADALQRLRAAGLRVDSVQTASTAFNQMQRSGPALADDFLLAATILALLVAGASTLGTLGTTIRQRATELAAFEVAGVSRRALAGSLAVEAAVLAVTTLAGTGAGILAGAMAIPSLPELPGPSVIPLQYGLPGGLVAAVSGAVLLVVLLSCAAVALVLVNRASPSLLRTAPDDAAS